jgi:hypothetical protein
VCGSREPMTDEDLQEMVNEAAGVRHGDPPAQAVTEEMFARIMEKTKVDPQ